MWGIEHEKSIEWHMFNVHICMYIINTIVHHDGVTCTRDMGMDKCYGHDLIISRSENLP